MRFSHDRLEPPTEQDSAGARSASGLTQLSPGEDLEPALPSVAARTGSVASSLIGSFSRLAPGSQWLLADRGFRASLELIVGLWMARHLGPSAFGNLSFALAVVALTGPLSSMGLQAVLVRDLIRSPERAAVLVSSATALRIAGGLVGAAVLIAASLVVTGSERLMLVRFGAIIVVLQAAEVFELHLQAHGRFGWSAFARSGAAFLASSGRILLILAGAGVLPFLITFIGEVLVWGLLLRWSRVAAGLQLGFVAPSLACMADLFRQSWLLVLSGFGAVLNLKIDQVMLGAMVSVEQLGQYAAAVRFSEALYFLPHLIVSAAFPALVKARSVAGDDYRRRMWRLFQVLFGLAIVIAVGGVFFAPSGISLLLGPSYQGSAAVFRIHVLAVLFVYPSVLLSRWLIAEGLLVFSLVRHLSGAGCNIALNLLLIPIWGIAGSAVATVVSYAVAGYVTLFFTRATRQVGIDMTFALLSLPSATSGLLRRRGGGDHP